MAWWSPLTTPKPSHRRSAHSSTTLPDGDAWPREPSRRSTAPRRDRALRHGPGFERAAPGYGGGLCQCRPSVIARIRSVRSRTTSPVSASGTTSARSGRRANSGCRSGNSTPYEPRSRACRPARGCSTPAVAMGASPRCSPTSSGSPSPPSTPFPTCSSPPSNDRPP